MSGAPRQGGESARPRVIFVQQNAAFGSVEEYAVNLLAGLDAGRLEPHVVYPDLPELAPFAALPRAHAVPPGWLTGRGGRVLPWLARFLRRLRPAIVHVPDFCLRPALGAVLARAGHLVLTHHTPSLRRRDALMGRIARRIVIAARPTTIFSCERCRDVGLGRDHLPPDGAFVLPFGVKDSWHEPRSPATRRACRASLGVADEDCLVLHAARLAAQKRQDWLLRGLLKALKVCPALLLAIAGDGDERGGLESLAGELGVRGRVRFLGWRSDLRDLMQASDLFALTSEFEGCPFVLMEAAAQGLPLIGTDVDGVSVAVRDGVNGRLVAPGDVDAIGAALAGFGLDSGRRAEAGAESRILAAREFTVHRMVAATENLYCDLLASALPRRWDAYVA